MHNTTKYTLTIFIPFILVAIAVNAMAELPAGSGTTKFNPYTGEKEEESVSLGYDW